MSVPVIGAAGLPSAAPTPPGAAPAQGTLPFMLLPLTTVELAQPAIAESPLPAQAEAPLPDDVDTPLIGWLFDSFALAATPPSTPVDPALGTARSAPVLAAPPLAPRSDQTALELVAGITAERTDPDAALTAEMLAQEAVPTLDVDPVVEMPTALAQADPVAAVPSSANALVSALGATMPMMAPTPVPESAPIAGALPPLVADGPDLAAELGERIAWQMDEGFGEATIELHPAELGALTIRIETQAQQAQVHILAAEPAARALLSQCLPQLRELLGANGLTLIRSQVEAAERRSDESATLPTPRTGRRRVSSVMLVDTYA